MRNYLLIIIYLVSFTCYGQTTPDFIKGNPEWTIKNNSDSSTLLKLDTLKLVISSSTIENSRISFDSNSFQFFTNCWIDTVPDETGKRVTVLDCREFRMGKWEHDSLVNALKLLINDRNNTILKYLIRDIDKYDVLFHLKKPPARQVVMY